MHVYIDGVLPCLCIWLCVGLTLRDERTTGSRERERKRGEKGRSADTRHFFVWKICVPCISSFSVSSWLYTSYHGEEEGEIVHAFKKKSFLHAFFLSFIMDSRLFSFFLVRWWWWWMGSQGRAPPSDFLMRSLR